MSNNGRTETFEVRYRADDGSWQTSTRTRDLPPIPAQPDGSGSSSSTALNRSTNANSNAGASPSVSVKGSARGVANKEYVEHEFFTLQGDCALVPTTETVQVTAGNTVNCLGLGKYLSGKYFVDEVTRSIDNSGGYLHSIKVSKNGFGDSLKSGLPDAPQNGGEPRPSSVQKEVEERWHVVAPGETLKMLAYRFYGNAYFWSRIAAANRMCPDTLAGQIAGRRLIIP